MPPAEHTVSFTDELDPTTECSNAYLVAAGCEGFESLCCPQDTADGHAACIDALWEDGGLASITPAQARYRSGSRG